MLRASHRLLFSRTTTAVPLSYDSVVQFRKQGYLVLDNVFDPATLDDYRSVVQSAVLRRGPKLMLPNVEGNTQEIEIHIRGNVKQNKKKSKSRRQFEDDPTASLREKIPCRGGAKIHVRSMKQARRIRKGIVQKTKRGREEMPQPATREDAENIKTEDLQKVHDEYLRSDQFQNDVLRKMRVADMTRFFESIQRPWIQLWHGDDELADFLLKPSFSSSSSSSSSVGAILGRLACEASGCARSRLFSDRAAFRVAWGNAFALHCDQAHVDFNDFRGITATTNLSPHTSLDKDTGGFLVLGGSHHVMRRLTNNLTDLSVYRSSISAWDFGELARKYPREFSSASCSAEHVTLRPGSVMLASTQLVWGMLPNYSNREVFSHCVSMMPDGAVYNGAKQTWLSKDAEGPLVEYKAGEPLNDDALFPILHDAVMQ